MGLVCVGAVGEGLGLDASVIGRLKKIGSR
jgi:hypothetical protein